ncbi:MAG: translation initiation factor IF-3 [Candidatus Aminicenantes bacterium RBG_16_66_30]|nr:MAG: translation initiation factor IF-3 [Candidatus Aminicenantes bacterium RBG_16_66_30]
MIPAREVRVIDDEKNALGVLQTVQAIQLARDRGLDLVEIAPTADPPVCKITDYGKFLYEQHKKDHEAKKHQKQIQIKEIKFRPKISIHDYDFKMKHVKRFLGDGNKVKITVMLRGREKQKPELGYQVLDRVLGDVKDLATQDGSARKQDWAVSALLVPTKSGGKDAKVKNPQGSAKEVQGHGQEKVPARPSE